MATEDSGTPTPQKVIDLATQKIKMDRVALIGVFGSAAAPGALVRLPDGDIARVNVGDDVAGGQVLAIGDDRLILARMGSEMVLKLPQI